MESLKGTQTEKNLLAAFAGESQARNRYTYAAKVAKKEGYVQLSALFEETAMNEKQHAKTFFKFLEGGMVEIQAAYRTAFGSHRRREIVLWQKVLLHDALLNLIVEEMPQEYKKPGLWMLDALALRDQWQSRLLRTSSWSPLF